MPSGYERLPSDKETLIFSSSEKAAEFAERVRERAATEARPGIRRDREVVAEAVAEEFSRQGDDVGRYQQPWNHTEQEHKQVQQLVNIAFTDDLSAALAQARKSDQYPRIIDLFHDVLSGQLYEAMIKHQVHRQSLRRGFVLKGWGAMALLIIVAVVLMILAYV